MSVLQPALLTWLQFSEPGPDHSESCGQNATASCLTGGGHLPPTAQAPLSIDQWMRNQGYPGLATQGTQTSWLQDALEHFGPGRGQDHGNDFDAIVRTLDQNRYAIVLVGSDHVGHPVPNQRAVTGHWVACYGWDGTNFHIANSGSGHTETYSTDYFRSCYRGITLDTGITPLGGTTMDPAKEESIDQAFVWQLFEDVLGRMADAGGFAWGLGVARKSHTDLLWQVIAGDEYKKTGGRLGMIANLQAQVDILTSKVDAAAKAEATEAGDAATQAHLAAIDAAVKDVQAHLTTPLPAKS